MEIKKIETYSLYEFCQAVQQAVIEGWRFDFSSNELFPVAFGSMLMAGMVKDNTAVIIKDNANNTDNTENKSEVKRGRKPKDNT